MGSPKMERKDRTNNLSSSSDSATIIKPKSGWQIIDFKELREYRDLFYFFVWRDIKVLYAQTILGLSWAVLIPIIQIVIFTIIFGKVAKIPTDGIPYILFSSVAIIPWTYMSQSMIESTGTAGVPIPISHMVTNGGNASKLKADLHKVFDHEPQRGKYGIPFATELSKVFISHLQSVKGEHKLTVIPGTPATPGPPIIAKPFKWSGVA